MVVYKNITLTFPLKSSYLIENTTDGTTLRIYLPTITSTSQLGAETVFLKNNGASQFIYTTNNFITSNLTIDSSGGFTIPSTNQYYRIVATRTSSGAFGWMLIGSG
jgi:hypothetical protein